MRVFVPCSHVDGDDEIVIRCSVDGQDWQEKAPIYQPGLLKDSKVSVHYRSRLEYEI